MEINYLEIAENMLIADPTKDPGENAPQVRYTRACGLALLDIAKSLRALITAASEAPSLSLEQIAELVGPVSAALGGSAPTVVRPPVGGRPPTGPNPGLGLMCVCGMPLIEHDGNEGPCAASGCEKFHLVGSGG